MRSREPNRKKMKKITKLFFLKKKLLLDSEIEKEKTPEK
jgi:hypothetical protein